MPLLDIAAIAVALAMDAFAVSIAAGVTLKKVDRRQTFRLAWHFGFFQAMMPVIGWSAGLTVRQLIERWDHWIAFGLLACVGGNMLREAFHREKHARPAPDPSRGMTLVLLSVATSIDALAVGLSLSIINVAIWLPAGIIGVVAALFTAAGLQLGRRVGASSQLSAWAEAGGGSVLLLIGLNILREHGVFSSFLG
jgi:manganese efflux pump family protein